MQFTTSTEKEQLLNKLMRAQLGLSVRLFSVFIIILLGVPLLNYYYPQIVNVRLFGFPLNWLFLGVLFFPLTWLIAGIYVKKSIAMEDRLVAETKERSVQFDHCLDTAAFCNGNNGGYNYAGHLRAEKCEKRI